MKQKKHEKPSDTIKKSPPLQRARPDLLTRVHKIISASNIVYVTAKQISDYLAEPVDQVWDCLVRCAHDNYVKMCDTPNKSGDMYDTKWLISEMSIAYAPIYMVPILEPPRRPKEKVICPICNSEIRRRHGRGKFHDPNKCMLDNIEKIMKG